MAGLQFPFGRKPGAQQAAPKAEPPKPAPGKPEGHECEGCLPAKQKAALYKKIIGRYKETIEAEEDKSVTELRSLVVPEDPVVSRISGLLKSTFHPYIYDRNFLKAAEKAFLYCRDEIRNEFLPLEFWLTPDDIFELKAADEIDKAILLCSLLIALENGSAKVVVETQQSMRHAFVTFEFNEGFYLMDAAHDVNITGVKEEILKRQIKQQENKVIYEFNNFEYNEW